MDSLTEAKIKGKVELAGKTWFAVVSRSRPGHTHLSRKDQCSCEAAYYGNHCHHMDLCVCVRCLGAGFCAGEEVCWFCGGTGDAR